MTNIRILKRDGSEAFFDSNKIKNAVRKATMEVAEKNRLSEESINRIADYVTENVKASNHQVSVEEIQDMVEVGIMKEKGYDTAQKYIRYRYKRNLGRNSTDNAVIKIVERNNELVKDENSNKNPTLNSTQLTYIAGEVSKDITRRVLLPQDIVEAHDKGIIHFHDADFFLLHEHNCCLVNLNDMLQNGTVISGTKIIKPHSFATACNIATQIIAQVASVQYGGQSISLAHLAPFVDVSRRKIREEVRNELENIVQPGEEFDKKVEEIVEKRLKKEVKAGVQTIQYQILTLLTSNGQTPFVTVYTYLDEVPEGQTRDDLALIFEEVLKQRIEGVQDESGAWITPAFPKLIYVLDEDNIHPDSKYYYLTELAARCSAKRMVPDYISAKIMKKLKGDIYTCMGCRSFLTPDRFTDAGIGNIANALDYEPGKHKYYGRFNQGVVTINLPYIACLSEKNEAKFWALMDHYLELCHKALRLRHERLLGTPSDVAPILWQHGALARLKKGETIDKLLYNGYSTISLGVAGLYECCIYMTGKSHTDEEAKPFAMEVMQMLNDKCKKWKAEENIDYSVYGTPLESTTYKFAAALQKSFGIIKDVSDHNYITNSYHVNVRENIDAFTKLTFEADFQNLTPGGAISYVELPNMEHNIPAVMSILKHIYNTIMYAELNIKSDHCDNCGYDGEIQIKTAPDGKLFWECPNCHCTDQDLMHVARRTCGYIGTQYWNQGRTQEIRDRVIHVS